MTTPNPWGAVPSYLVAADNHSTAASEGSFIDLAKFAGGAAVGAIASKALIGSVVPGLGTAVGAGIGVVGVIAGTIIGGMTGESDGKYIKAAAASGGLSFWNTGLRVSNWFGNDAQEIDTEKFISSYDKDLSKYYAANQQSVDLGGFIGGSLLPMVGSLKGYNLFTSSLNAAKMGKLEANFSGATGLLAPTQAKYAQLAAREMAASDAPMKVLNGNMLKSFMAGTAEESIQGAVASIAVIFSMKASPILTDMDGVDMAKNILEGALFGGAIGGVFRGVGTYAKVGKEVERFNQLTQAPLFASAARETIPTASKIVVELENIKNIKAAEMPEEFAKEGMEKLAKSFTSKQTGQEAISVNNIRGHFHDLTGGDTQLANVLTDIVLVTPDTPGFSAARLIGTVRAARIPVTTPREDLLEQAIKILSDPTSKQILSPAQEVAYVETSITYLQRFGTKSGTLLDDAPEVAQLSLADTLKKGQSINISRAKVVAGDKEFKFKAGAADSADWNPLKHSRQANQARTAWTLDKEGLKLEAKQVVGKFDVAVMKKAYIEGLPITVKEGGKKSVPKIYEGDELADLIKRKHSELTAQYTADMEKTLVTPGSPKFSTDDLAAKLDIEASAIEGTAVNTVDDMANYMATYTGMQNYTKLMHEKGRHFDPGKLIETYKEPMWIKLVSDTTPVLGTDGMTLRGMAVVAEQQRLGQMAADNAAAAILGPKVEELMPSLSGLTITAEKSGPGQGSVTSANQGYGTLGSAVQYLGKITQTLKTLFKDQTSAALNPALSALVMKREAAIESSAINSYLSMTPEAYVYTDSGLLLRRVYNARMVEAGGDRLGNMTILDPKARKLIPFSYPETAAFWKAHIDNNAKTLGNSKIIKAANGVSDGRDPMVAHPIPLNPDDVPFFAFVIDPTVTGTGHVSMIRAGSAAELDTMIGQLRGSLANEGLSITAPNTTLKTMTKSESEAYHKALGDYSRGDTISENYINVALARTGKGGNLIPRTDPEQFAKDAFNWHIKQGDNLARLTVATKYQVEFAELKRLGEAASSASGSKVFTTKASTYLEAGITNEYENYIKTALDITQTADTPHWTAWNNLVDRKFSETYRSIKNTFSASSSPTAQLDEISKIFNTVGIKNPIQDATMLAMSNSVAARGDLQLFVQRAGSILSTLMLRMDPFNALVNTAGAAVLTAPELGILRKYISDKMVDSATIKVPGTGDTITSPQKLLANAITEFFSRPDIRQWAKTNGFSGRRLQEYEALMDDLAPRLTDSGKDLASKVDKAYARFARIGDFGEKFSGNTLAEEFNRFVAASMARQLTDIGVEAGVISARQAMPIINTFVNRTQGIIQASQKPLLFQGPLGSSLGLFQTYQFNMAQQMLRHIGNGDLKTAGLAMGLQGTIFGMRGLPGFEQINANIIGTLSGNPNNKDLYDATYGIAGKQNADWLMYGVSSNVMGLLHPDLKMNLYTRGDVNPRFATIVPVNPLDWPIIAATGKLFGSMKEMTQKVAMGGDVWPSILQGIEHSGVSRPLQGMAQAAQAFTNPSGQSYSTSNKGNVIATNDLLTFANLIRVSGARPFDEAVALESAYRLDVYKASDRKKLKLLGETIKTTVIGGGEPTEEQMDTFVSKYVSIGGNQESFNKYYMGIMKSANTSQANKIADHLKSPFSQSMQQIMGDSRLRDFNNQE